jgi:hypothetical protein
MSIEDLEKMEKTLNNKNTKCCAPFHKENQLAAGDEN